MATSKKTRTSSPSSEGERQLLDAIGEAIASHASEAQADPIWGNSDVLVGQWRKQFRGEEIDALLVGIRVRRIAMLLDEISIKECAASGLKLNEMLLLMALRRMGEPFSLRPMEILKMHSVTSGTATYRIDQLTKQGLAVRDPDPVDRRGYLIRLTPHGLKVIDALLHRMQKSFREALRPMTELPGALPLFENSLRLFEKGLLGLIK